MTSTVPGMVRTVRLPGTIVTTSTGLGTASVILHAASIVRRMSIAVRLPGSTIGTLSAILGTASIIPGMVRTVRLTGTIGMPIASLGTPSVILHAASIASRMSIAVTSVTSIALTASVALGIMACAILGTTRLISPSGTVFGVVRTVSGMTSTAISMGRTILGTTSLISPSGTVFGVVRTVRLTGTIGMPSIALGAASIVRRMSIAVRLPGTITSSTVVCATGATINVTGVISSRRTRIRRGLRRRYLCRRRRPGNTFASVHMRFRNTRIRDVTRSVRGMRRRRNLDLDIDVRSRPLGDEVRRVNVEIGYLQDLRRELAGWDAYNRSNGIRIGQNLIRDLQTSADLRGGRPRLAELPNL